MEILIDPAEAPFKKLFTTVINSKTHKARVFVNVSFFHPSHIFDKAMGLLI
jgi:hypothetical protein